MRYLGSKHIDPPKASSKLPHEAPLARPSSLNCWKLHFWPTWLGEAGRTSSCCAQSVYSQSLQKASEKCEDQSNRLWNKLAPGKWSWIWNSFPLIYCIQELGFLKKMFTINVLHVGLVQQKDGRICQDGLSHLQSTWKFVELPMTKWKTDNNNTNTHI